MNARRTRRDLVIAAICAVIAGVSGYASMRSSAQIQAATAEVGVVQTTRGLAAGVRLGESDLVLRRVPASAAQGNEVSAVVDAVGRFTSMPLVKGETLLREKVVERSPGSELATRVPAGLLALPVTLSDGATGGKLLAPGDRVDVLGFVTKDSSERSEVVVSDVLILAVGEMLFGDAPVAVDPKAASRNGRPGDTTVVLAVTSDQGLRLVRMIEIGKIRIAVRPPSGGGTR